jgi:hypothetical protein
MGIEAKYLNRCCSEAVPASIKSGDKGTQRKRGSCLGSRAPKGRVPLIRPRRDRIMGSSILASLSEAGGNDPFLPMSGPLPPHSPVGRIVLERDPLLPLCKCVAHHCATIHDAHACVFNDLNAWARAIFHGSNSDSGSRVPEWHLVHSPGSSYRLCAFGSLTFRAQLRSKLVPPLALLHNENLTA